MGILVADSGSTKTDWIWSDGDERVQMQSPGLNPHYVDSTFVHNVMIKDVLPHLKNKKIHSLFFYGAGCAAEDPVVKLKQEFSKIFEYADIHIEHDLFGAARALFGKDSGITAILGTGSSSCLIEDGQITDRLPSLGFMIGDEGSAGFFGKIFLKAHFYREWPPELQAHFNEVFKTPVSEVLDRVYNQKQPNRYVASLAKTLFEKKDHPFVESLILDGFREFRDRQIVNFNSEFKCVGFVGAVAFHHQELLNKVLAEKGYTLHRVILKPIESLLVFHLQEIQK